jgi:hypothetical protein
MLEEDDANGVAVKRVLAELLVTLGVIARSGFVVVQRVFSGTPRTYRLRLIFC